VPVNLETTDIRLFIESVIESLKSPGQDHKTDQIQLLAKAMAKRLSIKRGKKLHQEEVNALIETLFACNVPGVSPEGKPTMLVISYDELNTKFKI
jgi:DNA mismatch repair protein MutL